MRTTMPREVALQVLQDADLRQVAVETAKVFWWDGKTIRETSATSIDSAIVPAMAPVRRLGSYQGARSKITLHSTRVQGSTFAVMAESKLERHCLVELDRAPGVISYQTQPFVVVWDLGNDGVICQIPDIISATSDRVQVTSVRPSALLTDYSQAILAGLMPQTFTGPGIDYQLVTDMSSQRVRNLNILAFLRWKPSITEHVWWAEVADAKPTKMGSIVRIAGGLPHGMYFALLGLAQAWYDVDLNAPIQLDTEVTWR